MDFYVNTLRSLVAEGRLDPAAKTLVVAGGPKDRAALLAAGFTQVTISNLDTRMRGDEFAPFDWALVDGENLPFGDGEFDLVIEHMGLHHCGSPHRALLEMYRVARRAVVVFENRDSATMRLAVKAGFVPTYELDAVRGNGFAFGGFRNTAIPNHVYRWTEREVAKTIASADPAFCIDIRYFYNLRYPVDRVRTLRGIKRALLLSLRLPFALYAALFPKQSNEFGFLIDKGGRQLLPWMQPDGLGMRPDFNA